MCSGEQGKARRADMRVRVEILICFRFLSNVFPWLLGKSWSRSPEQDGYLAPFLGCWEETKEKPWKALEIQCNRASQVYQALSGSPSSSGCTFWVSLVSFFLGVSLPSSLPWISAVAFYLALLTWLHPLSSTEASLKHECTQPFLPPNSLQHFFAYKAPYTAYSICSS